MKIRKIHLDTDGVLADFNRGVKELCNPKPLEQSRATDADDDLMWEAIRNVKHFYDKLELLPGALKMFERLYHKYDVEILSAIPKPKRNIPTSGEDKTAWAHRLLRIFFIRTIRQKSASLSRI